MYSQHSPFNRTELPVSPAGFELADLCTPVSAGKESKAKQAELCEKEQSWLLVKWNDGKAFRLRDFLTLGCPR